MVAALFVALWTAYAEDPDDQYLRIYMLIQQADSLNTTGQAVPALAKYREAQAALQFFQRDNPSWNVKVVSFRMNYLGEKLGAMKEKAPMPAAGGASEMRTEARTATPASTQVKLLDAGAEPRTVLRLHPKAGDKQTLGMTMDMNVQIEAK